MYCIHVCTCISILNALVLQEKLCSVPEAVFCLTLQVFSYTMLQQSTSVKAIVCCLIIISGFFMGVDQEGVAGKFR